MKQASKVQGSPLSVYQTVFGGSSVLGHKGMNLGWKRGPKDQALAYVSRGQFPSLEAFF